VFINDRVKGAEQKECYTHTLTHINTSQATVSTDSSNTRRRVVLLHLSVCTSMKDSVSASLTHTHEHIAGWFLFSPEHTGPWTTRPVLTLALVPGSG